MGVNETETVCRMCEPCVCVRCLCIGAWHCVCVCVRGSVQGCTAYSVSTILI